MKRLFFSVLFVFCCGAAGVYMYRPKKEVVADEQSQAQSVEACLIKKIARLPNRVKTHGKAIAVRNATLVSEVSGRVSAVLFPQGKFVRKGQVLVEIDDVLYKLAVQEAITKRDVSKIEYDRINTLVQKKFSTAANKEKAEAQYRLASIEVEKANANLANTKIKAPFDGYVGLHLVSPGEYVASNRELVTITSTDLYVDFSVPESHAGYLAQDSVVDIFGLNKDFSEGIVVAVNPHVDETHTVKVRVRIKNDKIDLRPGAFAHITYYLEDALNALVVPSDAVVQEGPKNIVYAVINEKGRETAVKVPVTVGIIDETQIQIISTPEFPLKEGMKVVMTGQIYLQDGMPVHVVNQDLLSS